MAWIRVLVLLLVALGAASSYAPKAAASELSHAPLVHSEVRAEFPLRRAEYVPESTTRHDNPTDDHALRFDPGVALSVGLSVPFLRSVFAGVRMGVGDLSVSGGPDFLMFETALVPRVVVPMYQRVARREFALALSTPLSLLLPLSVDEPEPGRAVIRETRGGFGVRAEWRLECLWRWSHSVFSLGGFVANRWLRYSETSWLRRDPATRSTLRHHVSHALAGYSIGYAWSW